LTTLRLLLAGVVFSSVLAPSPPVEAVAPRHRILAILFGGRDRRFDLDLYMLDARTGERVRRLASSGVRKAIWSPDHSLVAYSQGFDDALELWVVRPDGSGRRRLTSNRFLDGWPSWAPRSKRLVVERRDPNAQRDDNELIIIRADGSGERNLTNNGKDDVCPDWSPDGKRIAFYRYDSWDVFTIKPDGTGERRLTSGPDRDGGPKWSPDGKRILFSRINDIAEQRDLFTVRRDGSDLQRLTNTRFQESIYGWSPDGRHIVFAGTRDGSRFMIGVMRVDGSHRRILVDDAGDFSGLGLASSADGKRLVYARLQTLSRPVRGDLWTVALDGSEPRALTSTPAVERDPSWHAPPQSCLHGY
jgi:Tol biopolymer transport system component